MTLALALAYLAFTVVFVAAFAIVVAALLRSGRLTMRGAPGRRGGDPAGGAAGDPAGGAAQGARDVAPGQEWTASDQ